MNLKKNNFSRLPPQSFLEDGRDALGKHRPGFAKMLRHDTGKMPVLLRRDELALEKD